MFKRGYQKNLVLAISVIAALSITVGIITSVRREKNVPVLDGRPPVMTENEEKVLVDEEREKELALENGQIKTPEGLPSDTEVPTPEEPKPEIPNTETEKPATTTPPKTTTPEKPSVPTTTKPPTTTPTTPPPTTTQPPATTTPARPTLDKSAFNDTTAGAYKYIDLPGRYAEICNDYNEGKQKYFGTYMNTITYMKRGLRYGYFTMEDVKERAIGRAIDKGLYIKNVTVSKVEFDVSLSNEEIKNLLESKGLFDHKGYGTFDDRLDVMKDNKPTVTKGFAIRVLVQYDKQ